MRLPVTVPRSGLLLAVALVALVFVAALLGVAGGNASTPPSSPDNLVPLQINDNPGPCFDAGEEPIFTSMCPMWTAAQGGTLDLEAIGDYCSYSPGSGDIENLIINGAPGICIIHTTGVCAPPNSGPWYNCVVTETGNPDNVVDGVEARVGLDGVCDGPDAGSVDDFDESVTLIFGSGTTGIYEGRDCDTVTPGKQPSPRIVSLIVLEEPPPPNAGNTGYPIIGLAGFYIAGCASDTVVVVDENTLGFDRYCTPAGTGSAGEVVVYGRFVNLIVAGGNGGDADSDSIPDSIDNCPSTANPGQENQDGDQWGDACENCPTVATLWVVPVGDTDCDSFTDAVEVFVGTDPNDACADTATKNDDADDRWPADTNDDQFVNVFDVVPYIATLGRSAPGPPYTVRLDFKTDGIINVFDLVPFIQLLNKPCLP